MARKAMIQTLKGQGGQRARRGMPAVLVCLRVLVMAGTLAAASVYPVTEAVASAFPVVYSANGRYLTDQNGVPFPIMGRTAWFVLSLTASGYQSFVDDTASRGYSAIELHVVNHDPRGNNPPFNGDGDLPFLERLDGTNWTGALSYGNISNEAPDFTTPNEAYWSFVDGFLAYCESKGILVFLFPAYVGYQGGEQGWMKEIVANGTTRMQAYGAWIATRYKDQKNLVWMMGGDMGTASAFSTAQRDVESALLTGLTSVAGQQSTLFSAEWDSGSIATDQTDFGSAMTLNGAYSWTGDVSNQGRRAYAYSSVRPAFLLEEPYDEEGPDGNNVNPNATQPVRRFQWWGWLSTIGGYISSNGYVWVFRPSPVAWQDHLDTEGSRDMARLNAFIGSIAWYNLVPSGLGGMKTLVTAGGSSVSAADYVAAAATPSGTLLVAYVPPAHSGSITVDMTAMSGPATARWFDPTSGVYTAIGTGLANAGTHTFTTPGSNSAGAADWVLVLEVRPPSPPSNLHGKPFSDSEIDLTWAFASSDEDGFKLERRTGTGSFTQIAVIDAGQRSYSDTGLTQATTYFYQIRAFNGAGNSDYSNQDSSTTLAPRIDVQPGSWDYGSESTGDTMGKDFTIGNTGSSTLNVSATTLLGPDAGQFAIGAGGGAFALAPGESRTVSVTFAPTSTGIKNATFRLTSNDAQRSPSDIPITGTSPQTQSNQPDLVETSVSAPPSAAAPGASFKVTDTVMNQGGVMAGASKTRYYLALAPLRDAGDRLLTGIRSVASLAPKAISAGTASVTIPANTPLGTYYVLACADDTALMTGTNEGNNCLAATTPVQVTRPDLLPTAVLNLPAAVAPGGSFKVTDTVTNHGAVAAKGSTTRYYLSSDQQQGTGDVLLSGSRGVPGLAAGAAWPGAAITVGVPATTPLGLYYLLVCANDTGLVTETDKSNNCQPAATQVQVTRPDLVPTAVSNPPGEVAPGGSFKVIDMVTNQGAVAAKGSTTRYYLSGDQQKGTGDVLLSGSRGVPGLAAGAAWPGAAITVGVPATTPLGLYYLLVCANDTGLVTETDKSNNCQAAATQVQVTRPDLVPTAVSNPPGAVAPGRTFQVTDTVTNQGAVAANGSTTRYYLSGDQQKGTGDVLLSGSRGVPGLAAGAAWPGAAITVGVPAPTPLGLYYLLICADDTDLVKETDKSNSCHAAATQVRVTLTP